MLIINEEKGRFVPEFLFWLVFTFLRLRLPKHCRAEIVQYALEIIFNIHSVESVVFPLIFY